MEPREKVEMLSNTLELADAAGKYDNAQHAAELALAVLPDSILVDEAGRVTVKGMTAALEFAAKAHHTFEAAVDRGHDPHWAKFYAAVALAYLES